MYGATSPPGTEPAKEELTIESFFAEPPKVIDPTLPILESVLFDPWLGHTVGDVVVKGVKQVGWTPWDDFTPEATSFDAKMTEIVENTDVIKDEAMDQMVSWATGVVTVDPMNPGSEPTRAEAIDLFAQKKAVAAAVQIQDYEMVDSSSDEDDAIAKLEEETLKILDEQSTETSSKKARVTFEVDVEAQRH